MLGKQKITNEDITHIVNEYGHIRQTDKQQYSKPKVAEEVTSHLNPPDIT